MRARPLMVLGTSSHVGKSILTAALGRILSDDGFRVAPFKAQNMSLNSAATPDGLEIGRAQALQAEACRTVARAEMNPVLIKPSTNTSSQVVVLGRVWGQFNASEYHRRRVEELFPIVVSSFRTLAAEYDVVLLEGAGSPAEINLKTRDIANTRMAQAAGAACLLVGDIDRGGVFAALLGTLELLDQQERSHIQAFVINKFRGDLSLLTPGIKMMEDRLGMPCAGVVPYLPALELDEEDSVAIEQHANPPSWTVEAEDGRDRALHTGVIALPHLANFTDFDALAAEPSVSVRYLRKPEDIAAADVVIIPGTKQTLDDLQWLHETGLAAAVQAWRAVRNSSAILVGICGGMQILGRTVEDVAGLESTQGSSAHGLGLLAINTKLGAAKVTRCAAGSLISPLMNAMPPGTAVRGYEIHLGETEYLAGARPLAKLARVGTQEATIDGAIDESGCVFGTYLHGLFDEDTFRHAFLAAARAHCGLAPPSALAFVQAEREQRIDRLAAAVREALDLDLIYRLIEVQPRTAAYPTFANAAI